MAAGPFAREPAAEVAGDGRDAAGVVAEEQNAVVESVGADGAPFAELRNPHAARNRALSYMRS